MKLATHLGATHFPDRCGVMALSLHNLTQVLHQLLPLPNLRLLSLRPILDALCSILGQDHLARTGFLPCGDLQLRKAGVDLKELHDLGEALSDQGVELVRDGQLHDVAHEQARASNLCTDLGVAERGRTRGVAAAFLSVVGVMVVAVIAALHGGLRAPSAVLCEREPAYWSCGIKRNQRSGNTVACYQAAWRKVDIIAAGIIHWPDWIGAISSTVTAFGVVFTAIAVYLVRRQVQVEQDLATSAQKQIESGQEQARTQFEDD